MELSSATLFGTNLTNVTFRPGTTLYDGQTVAQHGFDVVGLQAYLEASPVSAWSTWNLTLVPEPTSLCLLLTALLLLARVRF